MRYSSGSLLLIWLVSTLYFGPAAAGSRADTAVGTVTFALGQAELVRPDNSRDSVSAGSRIYPGDILTTHHNGYVHLRFIDDALLSVRPESRLKVLEYSYSARSPASSRVHFSLEQGVTRSISGQAAKKARENFRFDTPVAAIGVRGTDFTVSTNTDASQAYVHEGAITVQMTAACRTTCNKATMELNQYDQQVLQVMRNSQIAYAQVEQQPYFVSTALLSTQPRSTESPVKRSNDQAEMLASTPLERVKQSSIDLPTPSSAAEHNARRLTWGIWSTTGESPAAFILGYNEIAQHKHIAVGNSRFGLFRDIDTTERVYPGLGQASFQLDQGLATLNQTPLAFRAADLNIDFARNTFDTRLELFGRDVGKLHFNADGRLQDGGFFNSRSATQRLGGAVSFDGNEAGYFFSENLDAGRLEGVTLWSQTQ